MTGLVIRGRNGDGLLVMLRLFLEGVLQRRRSLDDGLSFPADPLDANKLDEVTVFEDLLQ